MTAETALADLLLTKLNRPRVVGDFFVRPRLDKQLDRGLDDRLILVSAPAGYGKTMLVSSWLRAAAIRTPGFRSTTAIMIICLRQLSHRRHSKPVSRGCPETSALLHAPLSPRPPVLMTRLVNEIAGLTRPSFWCSTTAMC
jgi:LuxR family maltose regulon positive regulatory protein